MTGHRDFKMQISKNMKWLLLAVVFPAVLIFVMAGCSANVTTTSTLSQHTSTPSTLTALNSTDATVSIFPVSPSIKSGENFTVDILIDSKVNLRVAQCALSFDPSLMKCDGVVEGSFFKNWAEANNSSTVVVPQPVINNTTGQVSDIGVAIMGTTEGGVVGSGVFCTYSFTSLSDGVAKPTLSDVLLSDETGKVFKPTVSGN